MRYGKVAIVLLVTVGVVGCQIAEDGNEDQTPDPVLYGLGLEPLVTDQSCELSAECLEDYYCLDATCEALPADLAEEPGYPGLEDHDGVCRVVMIDDFNEFVTTLQVERVSEVLFVVTTGVGGEYPWSVEVVLYEDGELDIAAGVPDIEYDELLEEYELEDAGQLSFEEPTGYRCSAFEGSLIFFLIMEWFYFG
jgi:hypothetical protein